MYQPGPTRAIVWTILSILVVSGFAGLGFLGIPYHATSSIGGAPASGSAAPVSSSVRPHSGASDLVVSGTKVTISPANNPYGVGSTYYPQFGNITVENGGVLTISQLTVQIFSVTQTWCSCQGALWQRFSFNVQTGGRVEMVNSTIKMAPDQLYAYAKLNLTVQGGSTFALTQNSKLAFPGNVYVTGGSSLYVNESTITGNPPTNPGWPANYTSDNSYGPSLTVVGSSHLVQVASTINGTYASPLAGSPSLNENFVSSQYDVAIPTQTSCSIGCVWNSPTIVPATPLVLDTYDRWSGASVNLHYTNPTGVLQTASWVNFTLGTHSVSLGPVAFPHGNGTITVAIPAAWVNSYINSPVPGALGALLNELSTGYSAGGYFTVGGASAAGVVLNSTYLALTPQFQFNIVVKVNSVYTAIDSTSNVNWIDPTTVPAFMSHKFLFEASSVGYLVNSSANNYFTNPYLNVSAFVPDATSNVYVMQLVAGIVRTSSGASVAGTSLFAMATNPPATNPNNATANNFANAKWLATAGGTVPILDAALNYWATTVTGSAAYDVSNANGVVFEALVSNNLTAYTLSQGSLFGGYNEWLQESAQNVTGSGSTTTSERVSSPNLCGWPYLQGCGRPAVLSPIIALSVVADLRVTAIQFDTSDASGLSPIAYTENFSVTVNVTVRDWNGFMVQSPSVPLIVYDNFAGGSGTLPYNVSVGGANMKSSDFAVAGNGWAIDVVQVTFTLPYGSAGSHAIWAMVDPSHTTSWPSTQGKALSSSFTSVGVPFQSPTAGRGSLTTNMLDGCTNQPVTGGLPNTCNTVILQALITNLGDAAAGPGSVTVNFALGTQGGSGETWTPVGAAVTNGGAIGTPSGTWTATVTTTVTCTCFTEVQAVVTWTSTSPGKNTAPPFSFAMIQPNSFYTVDYTSLVFTKVIGEQLNSNLQPQWAPNANVSIGDHFSVDALITNNGGPTNNQPGQYAIYWMSILVVGQRTYWDPVTPQTLVQGTGYIAGGAALNLSAMWVINESVMDLGTGVTPSNGAPPVHEFGIFVNYWNGALNHTSMGVVSVTVWPSWITFNGVSFPSSPGTTFTQGTSYSWRVLSGSIGFHGSGWAHLDAWWVGNGVNVSSSGTEEGLSGATNGTAFATLDNFTVTVPTPGGAPLSAGDYLIFFSANYNGLVKFFSTGVTVHIKTPAATCSQFSGFFCPNGSPTLLLFVIIGAVAAVAAIIAAVFLMAKAGKGRLVECGECGELIPEKAPACPKCGAEFETEMVRCSRCASTIPASSQVCPECSAILLGKPGVTPEEAQRKDYAAAIERFRAEGRKELGENFTEGAFWDWWKRQPSYLSYSAFKLQQTQGTRKGMAAPSAQKQNAQDLYGGAPPPGGAGGYSAPPPGPGGAGMYGAPPPTGAPPPGAGAAPPVPGATGAGMKTCSSCQREINADFLVCPFCGA
ncbi:MAG: hypothetical protein KGI98_16845, partial [Euryarchaeota archaeon]|nr:hypothetical protein [Euryarchaeota archaeon]